LIYLFVTGIPGSNPEHVDYEIEFIISADMAG
jgi:hypothetical protein